MSRRDDERGSMILRSGRTTSIDCQAGPSQEHAATLTPPAASQTPSAATLTPPAPSTHALPPLMSIDLGLPASPPPTDSLDADSDGSWSEVTRGKRRQAIKPINTTLNASNSSSDTSMPVVYKISVSGLPPNLRSTKTLYQALRQHVPDLLITYLSVSFHGQASISGPQERISHYIRSFSNQLSLNLAISEFRNKQHVPAPRRTPIFSLVIRGVEHDITIPEIEHVLNHGHLPFRKVWRIRSRATGRDTSFIRILTDDRRTLDLLLSRGLYMFHHIYHAEPSDTPSAQPIQCGKCFEYEHSTSQCPKKTPTCGICSEPHTTASCKSDSSAKCSNCQGDHPAFTYKCPKRPSAPASQVTAAPLRPAAPVEGNPKSFRNLMAFMATAMLNLLPDQKERIQSFLFPLVKHYYGYDLSASYSGNAIHISVT